MTRQLSSAIMAVAIFSSATSDSYNYRPYISTNLAKATMVEVVDVIEEKCDGSGWIIHGDGHRTPCPGCEACQKKSTDNTLEDCPDGKCPTPSTPSLHPQPRKRGLLKRIFRK